MEGRTKLNYGSSGLITMKDINYMINIINSDLSEEEKAIKLYSFCNLHSLTSNKDLYNTLKLEQVEKLEELIRIYRDYESKGLFKSAKNRYKCTLEEIALRLKKINLTFEIMNSDDNDYIKAEQLLSLFKSAEEFRKSYTLFKKHGKYDERLSSARLALDNFDTLYAKFKEYEEKDIIDSVKYVLRFQNYFQNYAYAKFVISYYIESLESYKESQFLSELGIDKYTFNFCISTIKELDVDLYLKYLEKRELNQKKLNIKNAKIIDDLANGIKTGLLSDGTQFDLLEFIKRIPFKFDKNFVNTLTDFMKKNNSQNFGVIMSYINSNRLNKAKGLPLNSFYIRELYNIKTTVGGIEITDEDIDIIFYYLKINNIPITSKTYILIREKILNGEITFESVRRQTEQLHEEKRKSRILIPNNNQRILV